LLFLLGVLLLAGAVGAGRGGLALFGLLRAGPIGVGLLRLALGLGAVAPTSSAAATTAPATAFLRWLAGVVLTGRVRRSSGLACLSRVVGPARLRGGRGL